MPISFGHDWFIWCLLTYNYDFLLTVGRQAREMRSFVFIFLFVKNGKKAETGEPDWSLRKCVSNRSPLDFGDILNDYIWKTIESLNTMNHHFHLTFAQHWHIVLRRMPTHSRAAPTHRCRVPVFTSLHTSITLRATRRQYIPCHHN